MHKRGCRGNPPTHFQPIEVSIEVSLTALNLFRFEVRNQAIMGREARDEQVSSLRSLKSHKYHEFILNLYISMLAQSRDEENLKAADEEVSRAGMMAVFGSQIM
jgi:hypothetical protein